MKEDILASVNVDWRCPACNGDTNSQGTLFSGCRAVALHVAGKIRTGDHTHRKWALSKVGEVIIEPYAIRSINTLADEIESGVREENETRRRLENERIGRLIEERTTSEEPKVVAYRFINTIENGLHDCLKETLQKHFGESEDQWWVQAVPLQIRTECAKRREEDDVRDELCTYTNFIDLRTIVQKNNKVFEHNLRRIRSNSYSERDFLEGLVEANNIRRRVMHPLRTLSNEDLAFLKRFSNMVEAFTRAESD